MELCLGGVRNSAPLGRRAKKLQSGKTLISCLERFLVECIRRTAARKGEYSIGQRDSHIKICEFTFLKVAVPQAVYTPQTYVRDSSNKRAPIPSRHKLNPHNPQGTLDVHAVLPVGHYFSLKRSRGKLRRVKRCIYPASTTLSVWHGHRILNTANAAIEFLRTSLF